MTRRVALVAALAIVAMGVVYGASTTRQSAAVHHGAGAPAADEALLRFVVAHDLPARVTIGRGDDARVLWPVGPGSDHVSVPAAGATPIRIETFSFDAPGARRGTHRFTARADVAERLTIGLDGAGVVTPAESPGRPGHHALAVRGPTERTSRAWAWTEASRQNRTVYSDERGVPYERDSAFVPDADITISWEVAGPLHDRTDDVPLEAGGAREVIVDRDGRWSHRRPGALRAWWMRR